jgi:hypothetical protein
MTVFVVTGMGKERIAELVQESGGPDTTVKITSDFEAALAVQRGEADYYIGACQTGTGGALGVATAILGSKNVGRLSGAGVAMPSDEAMREVVASGVRAFGMAHSHVDTLVPRLVRLIVA